MKLSGEWHYLWRAVDHEGEVLESFVTKTCDKKAALKFLKKSLNRQGCTEGVVTDYLRSYDAALNELGVLDLQETGRWPNNSAENSHQPFRRRERAMLRSVPLTTHSVVKGPQFFHLQNHRLVSRAVPVSRAHRLHLRERIQRVPLLQAFLLICISTRRFDLQQDSNRPTRCSALMASVQRGTS